MAKKQTPLVGSVHAERDRIAPSIETSSALTASRLSLFDAATKRVKARSRVEGCAQKARQGERREELYRRGLG
jgi:hypothetical protein